MALWGRASGDEAGDVKQRWIMLVDIDAFFASVEELHDPTLRGKPLIVGGNPAKRGVVLSASYAARAYGVRSAMPMAQALRLCPQAIVVPPRRHEYSQRSQAVMAVLREITPEVEQVSIDEAFLDVSGCERLWGPVHEMGELVRRRILDEQGISVSLGIASSKLVAKMACQAGKPGGIVVVLPGEEAAFLASLPIEQLWGVGRVTAERLREWRVRTIGDLVAVPQEDLVRLLGEAGRRLYNHARGIDHTPLHTSRDRHSISQERTFAKDVGDQVLLQRTLLRMSEQVAWRLRELRLVAQTVKLKLRYPNFETVTRQASLDQPTDQGQKIYASARGLLDENWRSGERIRLLGVGVSGLLEGGGYQLDLFDSSDLKRARLNAALDEIRDRFGSDAIQRASLLVDNEQPMEDPEEE